MKIPDPVYNPQFNITRSSHVVLGVSDLEVSRRFYTDVIGLVVTHADSDALYLRGLEEACHHSLVLRKDKTPQCHRVGFRMFSEQDLENAFAYFKKTGVEVSWAKVAYQGKTLHVTDPAGVPLEFCARMPVEHRHVTDFAIFKGGCAHRLDHYQVLTPDIQAQCEFYVALGFRLSEYVVANKSEDFVGIFLQRKGNPHDLVFFSGTGPRFHHVAYTTIDSHTMLRACDVAGNLGFGNLVERGPGRHGPGHAQYTYFRDPDGHRIELFTTHYQVMDIENEPVRWDATSKLRKEVWGLPAQRAWFEDASTFPGVTPKPPKVQEAGLTLEQFLSLQN